MSDEEWEAYRSAAKELGKTISDFIRDATPTITNRVTVLGVGAKELERFNSQPFRGPIPKKR